MRCILCDAAATAKERKNLHRSPDQSRRRRHGGLLVSPALLFSYPSLPASVLPPVFRRPKVKDGLISRVSTHSGGSSDDDDDRSTRSCDKVRPSQRRRWREIAGGRARAGLDGSSRKAHAPNLPPSFPPFALAVSLPYPSRAPLGKVTSLGITRRRKGIQIPQITCTRSTFSHLTAKLNLND